MEQKPKKRVVKTANVAGGTASPEAQTEQKPKTVKAKTPTVKQVPFDYIGAAMAKYNEAGWTAYRCPTGGMNDFIAHRDKKLHYLQVVPSDNVENMRFHGEAKNTFIQNAFSNSAVPIHATVTAKKVGGAKITLEDVNTNGRVVVAGPRKVVKAAEK